jgi:hypothetical protein
VGEEKMSLYSSMILSTFFYCKERLCVEAMDVGGDLLLTVSMDHKEDELPGL